MIITPLSKYLRTAGIAMCSLGIVAFSMPAIAQSKPSPHNNQIVDVATKQVSSTDYWENLLNDVVDDVRDEASEELIDYLRDDLNLRDSLLDLFLGQDGDRDAITSILIDILLGKNIPSHSVGTVRYGYVINRGCLPPGQVRRLDSGKPVPPGILKKCGSIVVIDN